MDLNVSVYGCGPDPSRVILPAWFTYSSALKMVAVRCPNTLVNFYQTTRCHIAEDSIFHIKSMVYVIKM
jgi:hypothetical protein